MKKYILHINRNYSFEILRPLQEQILKNGDDCIWFVGSQSVDVARFKKNERFVTDPYEIREYESCAVFSPGNNVPSFIGGVKVQIFHGLEWKKKGHFRIRDFFDLYCTQGPITTTGFNDLARKHKNFMVEETGWSKLDPLFSTKPLHLNTDKPVILYAPTFSEKLTSAGICFDEIVKSVMDDRFHWLVKFHPLMDKEVVTKYKSIKADNYQVIDDHSILPLLKVADVMVSDTSSVIGEFMLLNKPVVAFKNAIPQDSMINIDKPESLIDSLDLALARDSELLSKIKESNLQLHPYTDGMSSQRILDAVDKYLNGNKPMKKRPLNLWRNLKLRKKYKYWAI